MQYFLIKLPWQLVLLIFLVTTICYSIEIKYAGKGYKCGKPPNDNTFRIAVLVPYDPNTPTNKNMQTETAIKHSDDEIFSKVLKPGFLAPAEDIALHTIAVLKAKGKLPGLGNYTLNLFWNNTHCNPKISLNLIFHHLLDKPVHAFLGPICTFPLASATRIVGQRFERPTVSYGGMNFDMGNKKDYPLLTRMLGSMSAMTRLFDMVFRKYGWFPRPGMQIGVLAFKWDTGIAVGLMASFRGDTEYSVEGFVAKEEDLDERLELLSKVTRIVVLCADPDSVRKIMIKAYDLNFINGEYVFFNIDLFSSKDKSLRPWYRQNDTKANNDKAKIAYRALMTVTLRKPDSQAYKNFSDEVKMRAKRDYNYIYGKEEVNSFVGAFHDAVLLYALALNDTLAENKTIENGVHITKKMWGRTFEGITGNVSIDKNGDRNADYSLLDMNPETGEFEVVANYYGNEKRYVPVKGKEIDWFNAENKPPPDTPTCGFDGSKCPKDALNPGLIAAIVMGGLVLVALVAGVFIYRHTRYLAELSATNWIISWRDIDTQEKRRDRLLERKRKATQNSGPNHPIQLEDEDINDKTGNSEKLERQPLNSHKTERQRTASAGDCDYDDDDIPSCTSIDTIAGIRLDKLQNAQLFNKTARYKGNVVALKALRTRKIETNKEMLIEVKKVRDLNNDHICRFFGACIEPNHSYIVTEYCPKGSLEDVLENDQLHLDWMFKFSLMQDICRGMVYLHNNLGPHGNLKSSNCLVDSRFVLKITDFGLHQLRGYNQNNNELQQEMSPYAYYRNLVWTAPEILRQRDSSTFQSLAPFGTKEGDVYSFAIVCQEIVYRNGVFYLDDGGRPEPQEIIDNVSKKNPTVPFRPTLHVDTKEERGCSEEFVRVVRRAWSEEPQARPEFSHIKVMMRKLNSCGDTGNILDNLLSRMEQYANNLEGLVAQRTEQYFEEKRKTEDLLYSMLPKSVAGALIRGETVQAESFEKVTIYFSDIVGFTSLSAESTPMQVICLLNKLYTTFDSIIENYDVYKVETIGDAYMVCSGLPQRNGNLHAREIARTSIAFLKEIHQFKIPHREERRLELRIGVHSGPVCAGVVGLKMPRYCLFGDTVNTSSRMESNGQSLKIHLSQQTVEVLCTFGNFVMSRRGFVEMKGKGSQLTYWLHGEGNNIVDPLPDDKSLLISTVATPNKNST